MRRASHHSVPQIEELFDHLDDVVAWTKDVAGRYTWVNRAFRLNYDLDHRHDHNAGAEPVGKTDYDFSPTFLADQYRLDDEQVLAGHRLVNRIELVEQPDG